MKLASKPKSSELHPGPGFRIRAQVKRPAQDLVNGLGGFQTPDISDLMNRLYTMCTAIHSITPTHSRVLGPACTVKVFPGDNLMVHKALDLAKPGDVIIVDAGGSTMNAVLGDLITTKAKFRGIVGFVVDGYVRDIQDIIKLNFPVFARGVTPIGPLHRGPGEVNFSIQCGGIVVNPGDIIIGDQNGVVVVPQELASDLLQRLTLRKASEKEYIAAVARGEFSNQWVDDCLAEGGCNPPDIV